MSVTFIQKSSVKRQAGGSGTALLTGHTSAAALDYQFVFIANHTSVVPGAPSGTGWTKIFERTTTNVRATIYQRRVISGETTADVTFTAADYTQAEYRTYRATGGEAPYVHSSGDGLVAGSAVVDVNLIRFWTSGQNNSSGGGGKVLTPPAGQLNTSATSYNWYDCTVVSDDPAAPGATAGTATAVASGSGEAILPQWANIMFSSSPYKAEVLKDAPIAYYRLGETSGTTMNDSSGNGRHGTYSASGITLNQPSLVTGDTDTAADFAGTSAAVATVPYAAWMDLTTAITVEAIIKPDAVTSSGIAVGRVDWSYSFGPHYNWALGYNAGGIFVAVFVNGGSTRVDTQFGSIAVGEKAHVAFTFDGTTVVIYKNGNQIASAPLSGTLSGGLEPIRLGRTGYSGSGYFDGIIDEVAVYPTVLTATRIGEHYNAYTGASTDITTKTITGLQSYTGNASAYYHWDVMGIADSYDYSIDGGTTFTSTTRPVVTLTGLTNGTSYNLIARGSRAGVKGPWSGASSVTPNTSTYLIYMDEFNRAANTSSLGTPSLGGPYTVAAGTWGVAADQTGYTSTSTSDSRVLVPGSVNFDASFTMPALVGSSGFIFRALDGNNLWLFDYESDATWRLWVKIAGTYTNLWSISGAVSSDTIRIIGYDEIIYVRINNVTRVQLEDLRYSAGGSQFGLRTSSTTAAKFDNVLVWNRALSDYSAGIDNANAHIYKGHDKYDDDLGSVP